MARNNLAKCEGKTTLTQIDQNTGWLNLLRSGIGARLAILCFAVWLHAANSLLAATTLPSAVSEFGGAHLISWAFSLYLLGSILAGALTGLLTKALGIRLSMLMASMLYLIGCVVCAVSPDMQVMLAGRFIQGLGGGFLVALAFVGLTRWFEPNMVPRLMALVSVVWSTSAFCGPLIGGSFATYGNWRLAFWVFAAQAALFIAMAAVFAPRTVTRANGDKAQFPGVRLLFLSSAVLCVTFAGADIAVARSTVLCLAAGGLLWATFHLDGRRGESRMFPSQPLRLTHPVGAGLLLILLASFATMSFLVYGPILLQTLHGVTPLAAGYLVVLESLSWGAAAVLVSGISAAKEPAMIRIGAVLIVASIVGFALTMPYGPVWAVALCAVGQGAGFGMSRTFVVKHITLNARAGQNDVAASAIPTMQQIGFAFGAAAAGIVANANGFATEITIATSQNVAIWIFATFIPFAILSGMAAWHLARRATTA